MKQGSGLWRPLLAFKHEGGKREIYKIAKIAERKTRDVNQVKCIKDGTDQLLMRDEEIKNRWPEYFDKLFSIENEDSAI